MIGTKTPAIVIFGLNLSGGQGRSARPVTTSGDGRRQAARYTPDPPTGQRLIWTSTSPTTATDQDGFT